VLLFDSIHYCLAAERALKARGVWHDVVPVPRDLSSDCGMAVEFRRSDLEAVRDMRANGSIRPKAAYRRAADGHELVAAFGPDEDTAGGDTPQAE
jgi:hypothetical protein